MINYGFTYNQFLCFGVIFTNLYPQFISVESMPELLWSADLAFIYILSSRSKAPAKNRGAAKLLECEHIVGRQINKQYGIRMHNGTFI